MIDIITERYGPVIVMQFRGTLTREVLKIVEEAWSDEIDTSPEPEVIALDFKAVTQIDSICINHIFKMARIAENKHVTLIIYDVFESLKKIFEVIKLDKVIPILTKQQFESQYLK
ncbi:MAG: STAS domain-containing protein [Spirochaetes bacterium]|nr:STAS domain-containing protein [Spirochaetota bacterium]